MYEFKYESERKEIKYKIYLFLFIITVLINTFIDIFNLGIEKVSGFRIVISLLIYGIILYFGLRFVCPLIKEQFYEKTFSIAIVFLNELIQRCSTHS